MALIQTEASRGFKPGVTPNDGLTAGLPFEFSLAANQALGLNDIIDLGDFPPDVTPFDTFLLVDDLDSNGTPAVLLSVGFLNAAKTDLEGTAFIASSTIGQTGGIARASTTAAYAAGASPIQRRIGIKVVAAPATGIATVRRGVVVVRSIG